MCPEKVDAAPDLPQSGGIQPLALDNHAQSHGDCLLPDSQHRRLALAQRLALTAPESVLEVNDVDSVLEAGDGFGSTPALNAQKVSISKSKVPRFSSSEWMVEPHGMTTNSWLWLW